MSSTTPVIYVIDDDPAFQRSLTRLLKLEGWIVKAFDCAEQFLEHWDSRSPGCLLLDVTLPGLNGLELQQRLAEAGRRVPIVFLTGHGDIPMSVRAIKAGATDFLTKPVTAESLLAAVRAALASDASTREAQAEATRLRQRFASLTPREREVLAAVAAGRLNKQIAADLGIAEQTVKYHRARIMERMQAKTGAELMHIAAKIAVAKESSFSTRAGQNDPGSNGVFIEGVETKP